MKLRALLLFGLIISITKVYSQDPNFHIYLCFGQSNMEGQGSIEPQDKIVDNRFKVFQSLDCPDLGRKKNTWYTAVPPLCQCGSGLSPADYFGRTLVANLPDSISVGVINVAVGGCDIRLFDKTVYKSYTNTYSENWFTDKIKWYGGNPYEHLLNLAKLAQKDGVIKGILLHQGETNTGNGNWPSYVQIIYKNLMKDLSLDPKSVPLLAGEVVHADQNGVCASMNTIIGELPFTVKTAHVISSSGCDDKSDNIHFNAEGYRKLGTRYGLKMLSLLGYEVVYAEAECDNVGTKCTIKADGEASNAGYVTASEEIKNNSHPPVNDVGVVTMKFKLGTDGKYFVYGRFKNQNSGKGSCWIKIDKGEFVLMEGLTTNGWEWKEIKSYQLKKGKHTISIAFAETGASLDKIAIKKYQVPPSGVGEEAGNICKSKF